jgi:hypothetical protein
VFPTRFVQRCHMQDSWSVRQSATRALVRLSHLRNHCFRLSHVPKPWKETEVITLPKPGKHLNSFKIYIRLASCPQQASYSNRVTVKVTRRHIEERGLLNVPVTVERFNALSRHLRFQHRHVCCCGTAGH